MTPPAPALPHLARRTGPRLDPVSDPGLGFAARALFEAAIDLDWPAAAAARSGLWPAIRARYGFEPDALQTIPADWMTMPLARLNEVMPLNLGMILHAEASRLRAAPPRGRAPAPSSPSPAMPPPPCTKPLPASP
ncbi:unnamed protein product [Acidocella sp. C78]|nr:unnamed protein product [Acidocella sp. C78]